MVIYCYFMGPLEFIISNLGPFFRMVIFFTFTVLGLTSASKLTDITNEKYYSYTDGGLKEIFTGSYELIHVTSVFITIFQTLTCFYCGMKVIHIPHEPYKKKVSLYDKYIWHSHEAIFLLVASGINSNVLAERLFDNKLFVTIYKDNTEEDNFMTDERFHNMVKYFFIVTRFFLLALGCSFILFNLIIKGNNRLLRDRPKGLEWAVHILPTFLFMTHIYYGVVHFAELYPESLKKQFKTETPDIVKNRHLEFVLENVGDVFLSFIGLILVWFYDIGQRNHLASTLLFNTVIMGFVGTCISMRNAYSVHYLHGDDNIYWIPLLIYSAVVTGVVAVNSIRFNSIRESLIDYAKTFYIAVGGNKSPEVILWRIGITLGIAAFFLALISTQGQWFTFDVKSGSVPNKTVHMVTTALSDIEELGEKTFGVLKKLDPCRWNTGTGSNPNINDDISYNYPPEFGPRPDIPPSDFSLKNRDIQNMDCKCKSSSSDKKCPCNYVNNIKDHVSNKRQQQQDLAESSEIAQLHDQYTSFKEMNEDSNYLESMKHCHSLECDAVLGVATFAEATIIAQGLMSFFAPGAEVAAADGFAWFSQMGNRVAHGIITFAKKSAKFLTGLVKKLGYLKPLITLLEEIAGYKFKTSFQFSMDLLLVYVPLIVNGFLCILIGFWRRENVHKMFQTYGVIVTFYVPLMVLNLSMVGLMYIFPVIVRDICKVIPREIMVVKPDEHVGFSLLRVSYIVSTAGAFVLLLSSLLDDAYYIRKKAKVLRNLVKGTFKRNPKSNSGAAETGINIYDYIDNGWLQAFIISSPILILFSLSYHYDWKFINFRYGPSGPLLSVTNSFHGHTNLIRDVDHSKDWVDENSLCGLIGKAIEAAIGAVLTDIGQFIVNVGKKLETMIDGVLHFSAIISEFENEGRKVVHVIEDTWGILEKTLVLIVPLMVVVLLFLTTIFLPRVKKDERDEVQRTAKQLTLIGIYYNIALMVMIQQLFSTVSNLKLHVFYFEFHAGPLLPIGFIASGLNALSLFSLYVESIYRVET